MTPTTIPAGLDLIREPYALKIDTNMCGNTTVLVELHIPASRLAELLELFYGEGDK